MTHRIVVNVETGVTKVRFANDFVNRIKILQKNDQKAPQKIAVGLHIFLRKL